jgi:hypothetical protein
MRNATPVETGRRGRHRFMSMEYRLIIETQRPYFAEIPYYLWGTVNYDSEGDCKRPTDRNWTWLELTHRGTREEVHIASTGPAWTVSGTGPATARAAHFLTTRCAVRQVEPDPAGDLFDWDHAKALERANRVAEKFAESRLAIFDSDYFWGSWKWIGWFATDYTWVGRMIMVSVEKGDARGVPLCIDWLKGGTCHPDQSAILRKALTELTGETFGADKEWIRWYEGNLLRKEAKDRYPEPDFNAWIKELKAEYGEVDH